MAVTFYFAEKYLKDIHQLIFFQQYLTKSKNLVNIIQMEKKPQLTSPPVITSGMENSSRRPTSVQDSLRFSYDFDIENAMELEEGKQINFEFQQYPEYEFRMENLIKGQNQRLNSSTDSSMNRKLQIFQKYRHKEQQKQNQSRNDIVESFDKIFNINDKKLDDNSSTGMFKKKINNQLQSNSNNNNAATFNSNLSTVTIQDNKSALSIETNNSNNSSYPNNSDLMKMNQHQQININHSRKEQVNISKNQPFTNASLGNGAPLNQNFIIPTNESLNKSNITISQIKNSSALSQNKSINFQNQFHLNDPTKLSHKGKQGSQINPQGATCFSLSQFSSPQTELKKQPIVRQNQKQIKNPNSKGSQSLVIDNNFILTDPKKPKIISNPSPKPIITGINYSQAQSQPNLYIEGANFPPPSNVQQSLPFTNLNHNLSLNLSTDKIMTSSNIFSNMYIQYNQSHQQGQGSRLLKPLFQQQLRIPPFIRKVRKFNSIYPNFNHPNTNLEYQSKYCNTLAKIFEEAFDFLEKLTYKALQRTKKPRYFPAQLASLNYFVNSQWEKERIREWNTLNENLRPRINFARTEIDENKIKSALTNYKQVITYYKQRKIDLTNEEGIKSYFRIRQKFWSLQKNMRSISEDVYRIYQQTQYPNFYYEYLKVLRSQLPSPQDVQLIKHHQEILNTLLLNRQKMQPLSCSQVGQAVKVKLERQLKFLCPF